jgi:hypothetical protein
VLHGEAEGLGFDDLPGARDVEQVGPGDGGNGEALLAFEQDEAFGGQAGQGLAQRRGAQSVAGGEVAPAEAGGQGPATFFRRLEFGSNTRRRSG